MLQDVFAIHPGLEVSGRLPSLSRREQGWLAVELGMLVMLGRGRGLETALQTVTRGDGGQNEIGPELFQAIGILRTEELLALHRYDGARQFFSNATIRVRLLVQRRGDVPEVGPRGDPARRRTGDPAVPAGRDPDAAARGAGGRAAPPGERPPRPRGVLHCGRPQYHRPDEIPARTEFEDAYSANFKDDVPSPRKIYKAYHLPFKLKRAPRFEVLMAIVGLDRIMNKARDYKVSITVYLVSIYLQAIQEVYKCDSRIKKNKILRVEVPVNLRKMYQSDTMRNFTLFVMPEIDMRLGNYTFEEIVKTVYHLIHLETDKKLISKTISRNVGAERNIIIRNTPLFIKSLILYFKYQSAGPNLYSGGLALGV